MKKEVAVICKAYKNLFGAQIKKEIVKCEDEKAAIAYAAKFVAGLNDDNAVKIRFISEDGDVDYVIDADKLEEASARISAMVSAYETVEENDEEIFDMDSAIEDELFSAAKEINWHVSGIIETSEVCKKNGTFQEGHRYIFGGVVTMADKKGKTRYYTYKWDSMYADAYETELTSIKKADAMEIARKWSKQNGEISFEEFMAASNAEYKEIRKNYLEQAGEGGIARQYDQDLWDEMQRENAAAVEEKVITTADLEKELSETNCDLYFARNYKNSNYNHIESLKNKIKNAQLLIAKCENDIQEFQKAAAKAEKDVANLEEKAAALEVEILNRKITESYADSIVTTAAFDASIEGEMAAAAYEPVKFELERFNDGETAIEETAEIETAVSEVPIVDDTEKNLLDEYNALENEIAEMKKKIAEKRKAQDEINQKLRVVRKEKFKVGVARLEELSDKMRKNEDVCITFRGQLGGALVATDENLLGYSQTEKGYIEITIDDYEMATYADVETFEKVVTELAAAIERGDWEFTFPADK